MLKKTLWVLVVVIMLINLFILFSGRLYLYRALWYNIADINDWEHFENRMIAKGQGIPLPASVDFNKCKLSDECLARLDKFNSVGFVALRNDSVIVEHYWEGYTDSSLSNSFSIAKSITSVLIGLAVDEGKIKNIDEPVSNYLPEYNTGKRAKLTIRHLLEMSSGIEWNESYANPMSLTTEAYYGDDLKGMVSRLEVVQNPGETFDYASCNQIILQQILRKATGKTASDYMSEKLWRPLHAMHDATWSLDKPDGDEKAYCCLNSNARDFSRIGLLFLHGGKLYDKQILSEEYINESIKPAPIKDEDGKPCNFYGLGWWLAPIEHGGQNHKVYYMRGILGQYVLVCPDYDLVVCRLGHHRDDEFTLNDKHHRKDIFEYTKAVLDAYF